MKISHSSNAMVERWVKDLPEFREPAYA